MYSNLTTYYNCQNIGAKGLSLLINPPALAVGRMSNREQFTIKNVKRELLMNLFQLRTLRKGSFLFIIKNG